MKFLICIFFSLVTASVFAQSRDTVFIDSSKKLIMKDGESAKNKPLIFVDNVAYNGLLKDIDAKTIRSIDVVKGKDAQQIYGESGKNGAILITTNKAEIFSRPYTPVQDKLLPVNPKNKKLIVIDGFIYKGKFTDIDPKDILSFDTLGNPGATNIYGEQGKDGVLLMTTFKTGLEYCQRKLSNFSIAYRFYLEANKNDDSGLVYLLNGVVLEGSRSDIIKKLHDEIEKVKTVDFIDKRSEKLNLNNPKPIVVITTKQ
jgi:hypothetical protein